MNPNYFQLFQSAPTRNLLTHTTQILAHGISHYLKINNTKWESCTMIHRQVNSSQINRQLMIKQHIYKLSIEVWQINQTDFENIPEAAPKVFPNVKALRLILINPLIVWDNNKFLQTLNQFKHLELLELYVENSGTYQSVKWVQKVSKFKIRFIKFEICVKTIPKQQQSIDPQILQKIRKVASITQKSVTKIRNDQDGTIIKQCSKLKQWGCFTLVYQQKKAEPALLRYLSDIQFPYLRNLHLINNAICSIQQLSRTNFPNLQTLNIGGNQLMVLDSLGKLNSSHFKILKIDGNFVGEIRNTQKLLTKNFRQLQLEGFTDGRDRCQCFMEIKGCIFDKHPISHPDQRGVNNEQTLTKAQEQANILDEKRMMLINSFNKIQNHNYSVNQRSCLSGTINSSKLTKRLSRQISQSCTGKPQHSPWQFIPLNFY